MRLLFLVFLAFTTVSCQTLSGLTAAEDSTPFNGDEEFRRWFAYYYKNPVPDRVAQAVRYMHKNEYLKDYPDIASIFIGRVLAKHPDRAEAWLASWQDLTPGSWDVLLVALWLSESSEHLKLMEANMTRGTADQRERVAVLKTRPPREADLLLVDVQDPRHINLLWSAFSATGEEAYVRRIIAYVKLYGSEETQLAGAIGEAALMTLASNVTQHEVVERICMAENAGNPDQKTRVLLTTMFNVLAQIKKEKGQPAH